MFLLNFHRFAAVFALSASVQIAAGARALGQQLETNPVFVYGKEWEETVAKTELSGDELIGPDKITAALQRVPNAAINGAGADSFTDVYSIRGLANTPNFSKQAVTLYVDGVPSSSTFTNFPELGELWKSGRLFLPPRLSARPKRRGGITILPEPTCSPPGRWILTRRRRSPRSKPDT
jgi:hypothetical protein